jgi:hypothetical protein
MATRRLANILDKNLLAVAEIILLKILIGKTFSGHQAFSQPIFLVKIA